MTDIRALTPAHRREDALAAYIGQRVDILYDYAPSPANPWEPATTPTKAVKSVRGDLISVSRPLATIGPVIAIVRTPATDWAITASRIRTIAPAGPEAELAD